MQLTLNDISYRYRKDGEALKGVSASFGPGINLILGPNGAGKSTLFKVIAGLLKPSSGECIYGKESTAFHSPHSMKDIFLLTDETNFPLNTINDMARVHAPFYPGFSRQWLGEALEAFGMTGDEKLSELSLGNRRKAQTAYALALGTKVLMLDEPANGLDILAKKTLTSVLAKAMDMDPQRCIIIATHTVQEMRNLFDAVTILSDGHTVLNVPTSLLSEKCAFISTPCRRPDAVCFEANIDGACQIIPNDGTLDTPIDYVLLFTAAVGPDSDNLKKLLS